MRRNITVFLVVLYFLVVCTATAKTPAHPKPNTIVSGPVTITLSGIKNKTIFGNVDKLLKVTTSSHLVKPITKASILNIYHNAPMYIRKAMQPYGFFNPIIRSYNKKIHRNWHMHFSVSPGVHSKITKINIKVIGQGATDNAFIKSVKAYKAKQGKPFSLSEYNDGNDSLLVNASTLGYFSAKIVKSNMNINVINNSVKISVVLDTGKRYRFGPTDFSKTPFNKKFLDKYIAYKEGQLYNSKKIQNTQNNYATSDYFDEVVVSPEIKKAIGNVAPIRVHLRMKPRSVYTFGLGYNTDTQIRGLAAFKYRWVNSWGHYINARLQGSFVDYNLSAGYHIPWPNPMKDLITFRGAMGRLDIRRGKSKSYILSTIIQHNYTRWERSFSFNYLDEAYDMYRLPRTRAHLFYPDASVSYYSTKNHINPDTGVRFTADVSGTPSIFSSTSSFARLAIGSKAVLSFFKNEQLVGRLSYGRIYIHDINNLPMSLQFLIGGSQTVRGYSYQSIGPGHNMLYGTLEFRQRIWKGLYIAGFYDFGNVTDNRIFGNMRDSVGPSILYRSPVGIIQISIPWRLSAHHVRPRFVFSIGPEL
jgi:translocation and assembly module TamA